MRAWPYQLFNVLPYRHMLSQWRECLAISGMIASSNNIEKMDGINHATINRIKDYPLNDFVVYCNLVRKEFNRRNWTIGTNTIEKLNNDIDFENRLKNLSYTVNDDCVVIIEDNKERILFNNFHNTRYLIQCLYKFQEMYDCKMITEEQWSTMTEKFKDYLKNV